MTVEAFERAIDLKKDIDFCDSKLAALENRKDNKAIRIDFGAYQSDEIIATDTLKDTIVFLVQAHIMKEKEKAEAELEAL